MRSSLRLRLCLEAGARLRSRIATPRSPNPIHEATLNLVLLSFLEAISILLEDDVLREKSLKPDCFGSVSFQRSFINYVLLCTSAFGLYWLAIMMILQGRRIYVQSIQTDRQTDRHTYIHADRHAYITLHYIYITIRYITLHYIQTDRKTDR